MRTSSSLWRMSDDGETSLAAQSHSLPRGPGARPRHLLPRGCPVSIRVGGASGLVFPYPTPQGSCRWLAPE